LNGQAIAISLLERLNDSGLAISVIALGELYEGPMRYPESDRHLNAVRLYLSGYDILGLTDKTMETFARKRHHLRRTGQMIPDLDLLIASTAITYDLTLVTRNLRHFERIADLTIFAGIDDSLES
jgi:tRNA(fMet)-specific endonuclease VapC